MITKSEVKYIQSLSDKKFRAETGVFVAEGPKIINEFLREGRVEAVSVYATDAWVSDVEVTRVSERELKSLSFLTTPNQVVGVFKQKHFPEAFDFRGKLSLLLDGIQDPGNLGTIIRIADWFGIQAIITTSESADAYNPKVVQATMGSIARVMIKPVMLTAFLDDHQHVPIYASALDGQPLSAVGEVKEGLLAVGNESKGISSELISRAKHKITIPRKGKAESLNAAVATGIILSAFTST